MPKPPREVAAAFCRYHCRPCGSHFTSLEAFDAHRDGPMGAERTCSFPDDAELIERTGACKLATSDAPRIGVTIYATARAEGAADYFRAIEGRETAPVGRKSAVA